MATPHDTVVEIRLPGSFVNYISDTSFMNGEDDHDPMSKAARLAVESGVRRRVGRNYSLTVTATRDVLTVLQEYAESGAGLPVEDEAARAEVAAAGTALERIAEARAVLDAAARQDEEARQREQTSRQAEARQRHDARMSEITADPRPTRADAAARVRTFLDAESCDSRSIGLTLDHSITFRPELLAAFLDGTATPAQREMLGGLVREFLTHIEGRDPRHFIERFEKRPGVLTPGLLTRDLLVLLDASTATD